MTCQNYSLTGQSCIIRQTATAGGGCMHKGNGNNRNFKYGRGHRQKHIHRHHKHAEFNRYRRVLHLMPLLILALIIMIAALIYNGTGHENFSNLIMGLFAFLLIKEILQALFFKRISKRFIDPLIQLKSGFDDIAKGNYDTRVELAFHGDMRQIFHSFNDMASKLEENEKLKKQYEENRKLLIANISHDLKTPITTVQGYLEVMDEGVVTDPEKIKSYIHVMQNNTEYMNRLIDDLFLFSKLDIDQVQFDFVDVNVKAFLLDMMEEFELTLSDSDIKFSYTDHIQVGEFLYGDGKKLHRAIRNIVENAVKYGGTHQSKVDVEASTAAGYLTLQFRDNGPGIPDDKLANIFDRFFRVDDERTKNLSSTGLGLAITKELITAHDGLITAGNLHEGGAVFVIQLPLSKKEELS